MNSFLTMRALYPGLRNPRWIAYRLIEGDYRIRQALMSGELASLGRDDDRSVVIAAAGSGARMIDIAAASQGRASAAALLQCADALREKIGGERFRDELVATLYRRAEEVAAHSVRRKKPRVWFTDEIDRPGSHASGARHSCHGRAVRVWCSGSPSSGPTCHRLF